MKRVCVIHYSEIGLKGLNRPFFEKMLVENVRRLLSGIADSRVKRLQGRLVFPLNGADPNRVEESLMKVFGISWFAFATVAEPNVDSIGRTVVEEASRVVKPGEPVKVEVKRAYKRFPATSLELSKTLGRMLVEKLGARVSLENPSKKIYVEVLSREAYVFTEKKKGLGGLPVGSSGRVLSLLSGGIDSPIASYLMMKRGCEVSYLHFHPFHDNAEAENSKVMEIVRRLLPYSGKTAVTFVPSYEFQIAAVNIPAKYDLVLFRRFMFRVAERIAEAEGARALVTGESLAQVASQTLENMVAISSGLRIPVFRPLIAFDKEEIVNMAKKIGTYELSIKPYRDCCSIIARHPATRAKPEVVEKLERQVDIDSVVSRSIELSSRVVVK
ncbi:MAG: tRNA 4-thiouridine(8) synthase ThiI [Candidatus Brockarchaeota archaeon]|nr:tRNA 4-thiouridine(8) synthase ThiI [Candidatus Brockarchaeota archaeon]MBO3809274.1 tRNA 4-thiouridine(8) synthase ThiI [Candidatus Brockarchaeota archaeon]